jgi:hypothetical protein
MKPPRSLLMLRPASLPDAGLMRIWKRRRKNLGCTLCCYGTDFSTDPELGSVEMATSVNRFADARCR